MELPLGERVKHFNSCVHKVYQLLEARNLAGAEELLLKVLPPPIGTNPDQELFAPRDPNVKELEFNSILEELFWHRVKKEEFNTPILRYASAYHFYVFLLFEKKEWHKALQVTEIIQKRSPLKMDTRTERLQLLKSLREIDLVRREALDCFDLCWRAGDIACLYRNLAFAYVEWKEWDLGIACLLKSLEFQKTKLAFDELNYIASKLNTSIPVLLPQWGPSRVEEVLQTNNIPLGPNPIWLSLAHELHRQAQEYSDLHQLLFSLRALYELTGNSQHRVEAEVLEQQIRAANIQPRTELDYVKKVTLVQQLVYDSPQRKSNIGPTNGVNQRDEAQRSALHRACEAGDFAAVKALIEQQASVQVFDKNSWTPLHCAAAAKSADIINFLLDCGADPLPATNTDATVLHYASRITAPEDKALALVTRLIDLGASPNAKNSTGMTSLHEAAYQGSPKMVALLLQHGASVNQVDKYGETSLHYATRAQRPDVMRLLLQAGADIQISGKRGTVLQIAEGQPELLAVLQSTPS